MTVGSPAIPIRISRRGGAGWATVGGDHVEASTMAIVNAPIASRPGIAFLYEEPAHDATRFDDEGARGDPVRNLL
jgi:hypothetical protein